MALRLVVEWSAKHAKLCGQSRSSYTFSTETEKFGKQFASAWKKAGHKVTLDSESVSV